MREVDRNLHTDLSASRILDHTRAEPVQESGQIRLDVEDSDPRRAEQLSLEIADVYTRQHNAAAQGKLREERVILSTLDRDNQATLMWPLTRILVPTAGVLGVLAAGLVILGLVYVDDSIRTPEHVQQYLNLPLLGAIPRPGHAPAGASTTRARSSEPDIEQSENPVAPPTSAARR
jgi:capsular polysaccharide biosynthesis protein